VATRGGHDACSPVAVSQEVVAIRSRRTPRRPRSLRAASADPVREVLASLPWAHPSGAPDGCVALLRQAAEERGADLEAVDPWVICHGGTIASTRVGHRAGTRDVRYYVVPAAALETSAGAT
jgi:hypothetical protein